MKIAIDVDMTLYRPAGRHFARKLSSASHPKRMPASFLRGYRLLRNQQRKEKILSYFCNFDFASSGKPIKGSLEVLQRLEAQGVEIIIMSSRPTHTLSDTEKWLMHYRVPFHSVICDPQNDKIEYCLKNNISILIDDQVHNLKKGLNSGLNVCGLRWSYNRFLVPTNVLHKDWLSIEQSIFKSLKVVS